MVQEYFDKIAAYQKEVEAAELPDENSLEAFRLRFIGTKNVLKPLSKGFKEMPNERKGEYGKVLNALGQAAKAKFEQAQAALEAEKDQQVEQIDRSAPGEPLQLGSRHPVSLIMNEIIEIFERIGFVVAENREIESEWYNFSALNIGPDHPARDMQDTYYLLNDPTHVLRSQTSNAQIHTMESSEPPIRIINPGRVYRNETVSARSHCQFHQVEGLYVAENVSFADLRQTLSYFAKEMFGSAKIRLRPSYFPFTEPSAEVDVYWGLETEADHRITKGTGWLEILGCGMVDPQVIKNCGLDAEKYTGFAFGMGVERIAMLRYQIEDIRLLFENDQRFLEQFSSAW